MSHLIRLAIDRELGRLRSQVARSQAMIHTDTGR
jgi:hypothetical protein